MGTPRRPEGRLWRAIDEVERRLVAEALQKFRGSRSAAAEYLGIEPSYVWKLAHKHNLLQPTRKNPDRQPVSYQEAMKPGPSSSSPSSEPASSPSDWLIRKAPSAAGPSWLLGAKPRS